MHRIVAFDTGNIESNFTVGTYSFTSSNLPTPIIIEHEGVLVVRDDLFPGGTKARFLGMLFDGAEEVVYASPAEGEAQVALATVARRLNNAQRSLLHAEQGRIRALLKQQTLVQRS